MLIRPHIKRFFDMLLAAIAIVLLLPIWLIISICIFVENPGPIFFCQNRVGRNGGLFKLYKFRSMVVNHIPPLELGAIKHAHPLVTKVGYILRRTKLDETPQFINVLRGDMSLIGPRPCLPERMKTMTLNERLRLSLQPGLAAWAEVNGNVELSWEEQVWLDVWYVKHWSLVLDFKILLMIIKVILLGSKKNEYALAKAKHLFFNMDH